MELLPKYVHSRNIEPHAGPTPMVRVTLIGRVWIAHVRIAAALHAMRDGAAVLSIHQPFRSLGPAGAID